MQRFKVSGFKSLVKSADLLKKVMIKLGVLDPSIVDVKETPEEDNENNDIVQVTLGAAKPVFNSLNEDKDYCLFVKGISGMVGTSIINENNNAYLYNLLYTDKVKTPRNTEKLINKDKIRLELWKYYNPKGPPIIC
jgi:hypothetical protein